MSVPFSGEPCATRDPRYVIVPVPYERTTTFRKGTAEGPEAILAASAQVELYDEETRTTPTAAGVETLDPVTTDGMPDALAPLVEAAVTPHLQKSRVVGCLGGEHSISLGAIRAAARAHPGVGVLQVDAHPDLRESYEGTRYGHGCVMRRVLESKDVGRIVQVGLRAVSADDAEVIEREDRVSAFYAHDLLRRPASGWVPEVLDLLPPKVYVSFDLDGLDPSVVPGTGTPEPGGLAWWDAMALLRAVAECRRVVGFDVVELIPEPPSHVSEFAAAHLVFKLLAYLEGAR